MRLRGSVVVLNVEKRSPQCCYHSIHIGSAQDEQDGLVWGCMQGKLFCTGPVARVRRDIDDAGRNPKAARQQPWNSSALLNTIRVILMCSTTRLLRPQTRPLTSLARLKSCSTILDTRGPVDKSKPGQSAGRGSCVSTDKDANSQDRPLGSSISCPTAPRSCIL